MAKCPLLRLISRITPPIHHSAPKGNRAWDSQSPLAEKKGDTPPAEVGGGGAAADWHTRPPGPRQTNDRWIDCLKTWSRQLTDRQHIQYEGQLDNWHFLQTEYREYKASADIGPRHGERMGLLGRFQREIQYRKAARHDFWNSTKWVLHECEERGSPETEFLKF